MGLDMYLNGKRFLSEYIKKQDAEIMKKISQLFPELSGKFNRYGDDCAVKQIEIEAGYWRKANSIHNWFVKEVQGDRDDCGNYFVSREQLTKLKELCEEVLKNKNQAEHILPSRSGFFFGSTEYDKYYFDDIQRTIGIIDQALSLPEEWIFEYHSSW